MRIEEMTIEELEVYRSVVEAYGTSKELYRVIDRIRELREQEDCSYFDSGREE